MNPIRPRRLIALLLVACGAATAQTFPSQPLHIVVGSPAGSIEDTHARKIGDKLATSLGQPVVVDNRPGATGAIAAEAAARAQPDGHTLLLGNVSSLAINPAIFSRLGYDPRSFVPVCGLARGIPLLLVRPDLPVRSVAELIDYAKARPGKLSYGSAGIGSVQHLAMEQFERLHGLHLVHIPYKGATDALTDLIGGRTELQVNFATIAQPHVQSGRVRALAVVGGSARRAWLPDVPTAAELGMPSFDGSAWIGFVVPAGTPMDVIARLNHEIVAAARAREYTDWLTQIGGEVIAGPPDEFGRLINADAERWARLIRAAGIRAE